MLVLDLLVLHFGLLMSFCYLVTAKCGRRSSVRGLQCRHRLGCHVFDLRSLNIANSHSLWCPSQHGYLRICNSKMHWPSFWICLNAFSMLNYPKYPQLIPDFCHYWWLQWIQKRAGTFILLFLVLILNWLPCCTLVPWCWQDGNVFRQRHRWLARCTWHLTSRSCIWVCYYNYQRSYLYQYSMIACCSKGLSLMRSHR